MNSFFKRICLSQPSFSPSVTNLLIEIMFLLLTETMSLMILFPQKAIKITKFGGA